MATKKISKYAQKLGKLGGRPSKPNSEKPLSMNKSK